MNNPSSTEPQPIHADLLTDNNQLTVSVQLFASAAEQAGCRQLELRLPRPVRLADLQRSLIEGFPVLENLTGASRWAVDCEFVAEDYVFEHDAMVAMIPPVSGG